MPTPQPASDLPTTDADLMPEPPGCAALFTGFLGLGLIGFGGVLPMARHMIVEDKRWLTPDAFTEMLGLCQFLPGGNIINLSVAIGLEFRGVAGAFCALMGLILGPTAVVVGLGVIYDRYSDDPHVQGLFAGLAAAAAGLLVATSLKMLNPLWRRPVSLAVVVLCVLTIAILRLPLLPSMAVLAPLSVFAVRWSGR